VGEHDFASLTRLHHGRESTVREVFSCDVTRPAEHRIAIDVSGNGFLYNMVRIIAGTLMEVGRGKWGPDEIPAILEARDRTAAGPTLPPEGLCLMWIRYGE
jgi:tRNA pseudouridine38-40 synthase